MIEEEEENQKVKEPFCPVCIAAVPLAFSVSAGTIVATTTEDDCEERDRRRRHKIMWGCGGVGLISLILIIYFLLIRCSSCA
jgi:hypothetical protein